MKLRRKKSDLKLTRKICVFANISRKPSKRSGNSESCSCVEEDKVSLQGEKNQPKEEEKQGKKSENQEPKRTRTTTKRRRISSFCEAKEQSLTRRRKRKHKSTRENNTYSEVEGLDWNRLLEPINIRKNSFERL